MTCSVIAKLVEHATKTPDALAYLFLTDGQHPGPRLTYAELFQRVGRLSEDLTSRNLEGKRALLLYPQGLDAIVAFLACLASGVITIPAPAPEAGRLKRTRPRLTSIVEDSGAVVALTTGAIIKAMGRPAANAKGLDALDRIDTTLAGSLPDNRSYTLDAKSTGIAYLQYTSGSTSAPKGVCIGNAGLFDNIVGIIESAEYGKDAVTVTWMPYFHDYGLVEGLLLPLVNGTPCYVMSPFAFLRKPANWLKAISRYRATHSQAPTFAYRACVDRIADADLEDLDLSRWKYAAIAAEPVHAETIEAFGMRFANVGFEPRAFSPCYGLAEYVLVATCTPPASLPLLATFDSDRLQDHAVVPVAPSRKARTLVGCGFALKGTEIRIVDPETCRASTPERVGEVWLKVRDGQAGYWNNPDATHEDFRARLSEPPEAGPYLRTGDMGFMHQGQLFLTGRRKDLIILNGKNHWPQDIERVVERCHDAVLRNNCCAAFSIDEGTGERLVVVIEVARRFSGYEALYQRAIKDIFEAFEIPVCRFVVVRNGGVPKTSSGKISRRACKDLLLRDALPVLWSSAAPPADGPTDGPSADAIGDDAEPTTRWLREEIARLAKLAPSRIVPSGLIHSYGLDSVDLTELSLAIEETYDRSIPISELGKDGRTVMDLAKIIDAEATEFSGRALVPLRTSGSDRPIFLVHPAGGSAMGYGKLARMLPPEHPVYGLQSYGLVAGVQPLQSIEEMARRYLDEIRLVQPQGPYLLGGMCLGGMIAYEIACMLERSGERVDLLALIDPRNPPTLLRMAMQDAQAFATHVQLSSTPDIQSLRAGARSKEPISIPKALFATDPLSRAVQAGNAKARDTYLPRVYSGSAVFFWAGQTPGDMGFFHDPKVCWTSLIKGACEIHSLNCNHFQILDEPTISDLAKCLSKSLETTRQPGSVAQTT